MGFLRIIHPKHYDPDTRRFRSLAFKPSSDGGISVVSRECIEQTGSGVCAHIAKFYRSVLGEPPIFWEIPETVLPTHCQFIQDPSDTGDDCHHNLIGLSDREARRIIKQTPLDEMRICEVAGAPRPLTEADLDY
jgi:hypothetical protein